MVSKARMRSWFATTEFFVVIAMFLLIAGLLANGQVLSWRTSESASDPAFGSSHTTGDQETESVDSAPAGFPEFSAVQESDVVGNPFVPTLQAVDLAEPSAQPKSGSRSVPEPTSFGLLGSLAALFLLVNRMRSFCR